MNKLQRFEDIVCGERHSLAAFANRGEPII